MSTTISQPGGAATLTATIDQTASRAVNGTVYQNTTGKTMLVEVTCNNALNATLYAYSDAATPPATTKAADGSGNSGSNSLCSATFLVLKNHYYKVNAVGGLQKWIETT